MKKTMEIELNFSSAHFYHQVKWTDEENKKEFGPCFSKFGHGHNYRWLIQTPHSEVDLKSDPVLPSETLLSLIKFVDHKHLNKEVPYFQKKIPTTENIALYLKEKLDELQFPWTSFKLFETDSIWVEIKNV